MATNGKLKVTSMANLTVEVTITRRLVWRLKLSMLLMRMAAWVGGFGIEITNEIDPVEPNLGDEDGGSSL